MPRLDRVSPQIRELALHCYLGVGEIGGGGRSRLEIVVGPANRNPAGALHGGVLYLLCDVACGGDRLLARAAVTQSIVSETPGAESAKC